MRGVECCQIAVSTAAFSASVTVTVAGLSTQVNGASRLRLVYWSLYFGGYTQSSLPEVPYTKHAVAQWL